MPIDGYEHTHLWLWRSKFRYPWPLAPMLDPDWDDRDWELDVVERLQRGGSLSALSVGELFVSTKPEIIFRGGWEAAEEYAKDADRSGSPYLNDHAISMRLTDRELRKKAWAEFLEADRVRVEAERIRRAEEKAARDAAQRAWEEKFAEKARREAERAAEWEQGNAELAEASRQRQAQLDEYQRRREEQAILKNKWQCTRCKGLAITIEPEREGYSLECRGCGSKAWGARRTFLKMVGLAA